MPCSQTQATAAGVGFLRANNDKVTVRKIIHRDPQAYEECEDWSLQMIDKERGVLNALVLMQEPGESIETTVEFSSPQVLALEAGVAGFGYILRAGYADLTDPGEYERGPVITGLGFDRASEDERKARHIVKICRRGTAFQCGKDPGFHRAQEAELKVRKILKICRKADELFWTILQPLRYFMPRTHLLGKSVNPRLLPHTTTRHTWGEIQLN
jgi:hypothetical protein